jgi:hypothetical protein
MAAGVDDLDHSRVNSIWRAHCAVLVLNMYRGLRHRTLRILTKRNGANRRRTDQTRCQDSQHGSAQHDPHPATSSIHRRQRSHHSLDGSDFVNIVPDRDHSLYGRDDGGRVAAPSRAVSDGEAGSHYLDRAD